jgi:hypothetical protein
MRKSWRKIFASGVAAVAAVSVIAVGAPSALATGTTWTVSPGGDYSGFTYGVTVTDTATGTQFTCTHDGKIEIYGQFASGSGGANPIGVINQLKILYGRGGIHCSGPGGVGTLDGTALNSFNGKVRFQYHNADAQLDLLPEGADLKAVDLNVCSGVPVNLGDPMTVQAKFTLKPAQAISSP